MDQKSGKLECSDPPKSTCEIRFWASSWDLRRPTGGEQVTFHGPLKLILWESISRSSISNCTLSCPVCGLLGLPISSFKSPSLQMKDKCLTHPKSYECDWPRVPNKGAIPGCPAPKGSPMSVRREHWRKQSLILSKPKLWGLVYLSIHPSIHLSST